MRAFILVFFFLGLTAKSAFSEHEVRGSPNQLPEIDYSKQFDMKKFNAGNISDFNRTFGTRDLEVKTLKLPRYFGNLKPLSLTEWSAPRPDLYSKTIQLPGYQMKKAADRWAESVTLRKDDFKSNNLDSTDKKVPTSNLELEDKKSPENVSGEDLKKLINQGAKPSSVKVGNGFNARAIESESGTGSTEQLKTESQPK